MVSLACYSIRGSRVGSIDDLDEFVEEVGRCEISDYSSPRDFEARLYLRPSYASRPPWADYVRAGFPAANVGPVQGPVALVVVRLLGKSERQVFAFAFGSGGRHLLKADAYHRGFGLRSALNLIYQRGNTDGARLRAVDSKRRGPTTTRARVQSSDQATFETFDVNRMRDLLSKAAGTPVNTNEWGRRVTGGDALSITIEVPFADLGNLCRRLTDVHERDDYQTQFGWIDNVKPIEDPHLIDELRTHVSDMLSASQTGDLTLAPPEIIDWETVSAFRYHFDRRSSRNPELGVTRPDLRLVDYLAGASGSATLADHTYDRLKSRKVFAVNGDGADIYSWSIWQCLVGEIQLNGETFILDEGAFYSIQRNYLAELNAEIAAIPTCTRTLPSSSPTEWEATYNARAATQGTDLLLLDRQTVRHSSRTTPIELCDLLSTTRQLIHVKRHLGSSDLSHLFAQGVVSASALQESPEFRERARTKVEELAIANGRPGFEFFDQHFRSTDYEIVYAIAERWNGRTLADALPFFSKINLREAANNLRGRGFNVSLAKIDC